MDTVSIWRFDTSDGAEVALRALERLQARRLLAIDDVAVVSWRPGSSRPHAYQVGTAAGTAALSGAFWGLLFGLLFLLPHAGVTEGGVVLARVGLTGEFLTFARERITPGTSALFLLTDRAVVGRLREASTGADSDLLVNSLDREQAAVLHRAFDADDDVVIR